MDINSYGTQTQLSWDLYEATDRIWLYNDLRHKNTIYICDIYEIYMNKFYISGTITRSYIRPY